MYSCPECGDMFASLEGVAMHYVNMMDKNHQKYDTKFDVKMAVKDNQLTETVETDSQTVDETVETDSQTVTDGGGSNNTEYSLPEFETKTKTKTAEPGDRAADCCDNPSLVGSAGDLFRLDDGTVVRLDGSEQICENCDEVHK